MPSMIPPEEIARVEYLETTCIHMNHAWDGLEEMRLYVFQVCQRGTAIKGADAGELFCAIEDVMRELDKGWLLIKQERARGTTARAHSAFAPLSAK